MTISAGEIHINIVICGVAPDSFLFSLYVFSNIITYNIVIAACIRKNVLERHEHKERSYMWN